MRAFLCSWPQGAVIVIAAGARSVTSGRNASRLLMNDSVASARSVSHTNSGEPQRALDVRDWNTSRTLNSTGALRSGCSSRTEGTVTDSDVGGPADFDL